MRIYHFTTLLFYHFTYQLRELFFGANAHFSIQIFPRYSTDTTKPEPVIFTSYPIAVSSLTASRIGFPTTSAGLSRLPATIFRVSPFDNSAPGEGYWAVILSPFHCRRHGIPSCFATIEAYSGDSVNMLGTFIPRSALFSSSHSGP